MIEHGQKDWSVFLAGEIHSNWRDEIQRLVERQGLGMSFFAPVTDHAASDECGVAILGEEANSFWKDHKAAKINAIRTKSLINAADIVVVRFGDKYRQWNAAFDAGYAAALGKPLIAFHSPELTHALKELDAAAMAVCETAEQVAQILTYVAKGQLQSASTIG